jgi:hypothetical protein
MSSLIYQQDSIRLDADRISEEKHPVFGDMTVFHNVVIASEMVQPYKDGKALKHRDELEAYSWTVDGRWIIVGGHPEDAIISDRAQVGGRTMNPRYVKNLKDPKTQRPNRAGVVADIQVFNNKISKQQLDDMKSGKKADVSIGFFYMKDEKAGTVEDGPFKGDAYDYVQRNMFHDHTAVGLEDGRCPSPYCGLGADQIADALANDPFSGFSSFKDCLSKVKKENPDLSDESVKKICGKLKAEHESKDMENTEMGKLVKELAKQLLDELEEIKGVKDSKEEKFPVWWKGVDWKEPEMATIFDHLSPDVKKLITEAGDCPECKKKKASDMTLEDINAKIAELQKSRQELKDKIDAYYKEQSEKAPTTTSPTTEWYNEITKIDEEIEMFYDAKAFKIAIGDSVSDIDGYELDYVEKDAQLSYTAKKEHPDEDYAYIDKSCEKVDGKTPQSCRHLLIHDAAHVRAALAALEGARSGKPPPYADEAKPKVCAAAKKFKIESTVCGTTKKDEVEPEKKVDEKKLPKADALDPRAVLERAKKILGS